MATTNRMVGSRPPPACLPAQGVLILKFLIFLTWWMASDEMPTFVTSRFTIRMLLEWTISDEDDECEGCQDKRKILKNKN